MVDKKEFLLLDFDGVVADTFHIAHNVVKRLCVFLTETEYRKSFEGNIHDMHKRLEATDHGDRCDHALDWMAEYAPEFKIHARPFARMPDLVRELSQTYSISIVSSCHDDLIQHFLQVNDLVQAVAGVYGAEVNPHKDEKFRSIFAKYGISAQECIFVTDTLGDINEATSVGLATIGVTWGFQDRHTLEHGAPFAIIDSPEELKATIERYFKPATLESMEFHGAAVK